MKVEDSFIKTGGSNWKKNVRNADKGFQKHESSKCHQAAIQILMEIPKSSQNVSTKVKNNLTETQCENRATLLKTLSSFRH